MEIEVRTFNLSRNSWAQSLVEQYLKKIKPFEKISFRLIKDEKKWLAGIEAKDRVWVCDENGDSLSSVKFSKNIENLRDGGCRKIFFLIGGPFGFSKSVKERSDQTILLSPFVMNQEVALTVLMEQIFRAYTIINGHPYHNE